ncbi:MAG: GTP 3',8-cyclase MoaA [Thermoplasmata archaeon]|nr:GTP 3',8-cyclase MoaA [Thermoplasmata archaeon]MCI4359253.1 GTP 3',8-cyclase MoaA [Thermoplasmata archaeon]
MQDRYGREVSDLRISLTQRCNLRCVFCHMEGQPVSTEELSPSEIERVVRAGARVGIDRVKLTGGEPTLRTDIVEIVRRIRPHLREVSMTTNGLKLRELAGPLSEAGLDRVNVSLPSLDPDAYQRLTGVDGVARTVEGIRAAVRAGLTPVKLNVVALYGMSARPESVDRLVAFAQDVGAWVQVIEFENVSGRVDPKVYRALHSELGRLSEEAAARAFRVDHNPLHDRPRYTFESGGRPVTVEVVQPVENPAFCMACHRLRLTSDGRLKGCLMTNDGLLDLRSLLRSDAPEEALVAAFERAIARRRPFFVGPETPSPAPLGREEALAEGSPLPMVPARPVSS